MTNEELIEDLIDNANDVVDDDMLIYVPEIVNAIVDRLMVLGRIVLDPPDSPAPTSPFEAQTIFKNKLRYDIDAIRTYMFQQLNDDIMHTRATMALEDAYRYGETAIASKHPIGNTGG